MEINDIFANISKNISLKMLIRNTMFMKKMNLLLIMSLVCGLAFAAKADDKYYDKHIIIAVDQKIIAMSQNDGGDKAKEYAEAYANLCSAIEYMLKNGSFEGCDDYVNNNMSLISSGFSFDEKTDRVSLFAYGIPSYKYPREGRKDYLSLRRNITADNAYELISEYLLHERAAYYYGCGYGVDEFIEKGLKPVFYNDKVKNEMISAYKSWNSYDDGKGYGINLSHYVYPLILGHIDTSVKAKEYFILIVSDFTSLVGYSDPEDRNRINEIVGSNGSKYIAFHHMTNDLSSLYSSADIIRLIPKERGERKGYVGFNNREDYPFILGKKILLDACLGASTFVSSDIVFKQRDLDEPYYDLGPQTVTFNHDGEVSLEKIKFILTGPDGNLIYEETDSDKVELESMYNPTGKCYNFPKIENLNVKNLEVGDTLFFKYIFYTNSESLNGKTHEVKLPYIYVTDKEFVLNEDVFVPHPYYSQMEIVGIIFLVLLALGAIAGICVYLFYLRGKNRNVTYDFTIWPITNERFMEVKNNRVLNYDCWYWRDGEVDHNIRITGRYIAEDVAFAKRYKYVVQFSIFDADTNENFSFRPGTEILNSDGSQRVANEWYTAQEDSNESGMFSFNANVYISEGTVPAYTKTPDFSIDNVLEVEVKVRVAMVDKKDNKVIKYVKLGNNESCNDDVLIKRYSFIVKPKLDNSNLWMAFDPGTTGSCVAYGVAALPTDTDDINMAKNPYQDTDGTWRTGVIFPSKIRINKKSEKLFNGTPVAAESLIEGEGLDADYVFGNRAEMLSAKNGANTFQSIKKLLGYKSPQKIVSDKGEISEISGQDLAHLLVKGLYRHVEKYISDELDENDDVRALFMKNGYFDPQRAIVAVPNNYTLVKIQEMVDSVKRMNTFKEVHYIYESEAVMMTYLRENWKNLLTERSQIKDRIYVVYDMGGATINATVFKLNVNIESVRGNDNIRSLDVETIAKVGYGIGGDDIDYAIIQLIYGIPSIKNELTEDATSHQRKHKEELITLARMIKIGWIDSVTKRKVSGSINTVEDFWGCLLRYFPKDVHYSLEPESADLAYLEKEGRLRRMMKKFVINFVGDAIENLFSTVEQKENVVLIMSGRSVLYPGIYDKVKAALNKMGCGGVQLWGGYSNADGTFNAEKVKSAVAIGACWYAMYSNRINMYNNIVTSSFGYIDYVNGEQKFVPIIERGCRYDGNGECSGSAETLSTTLNTVRFVQMLGVNYDEIYSQGIKHKMNVLDVVRPQEISTWATKVQIMIDNKNNFSYIVYDSAKEITDKNNPNSRLTSKNVKTEIVDENSPAYIYATLNAVTENRDEVIAEETEVTKKVSITQRNSKGSSSRF